MGHDTDDDLAEILDLHESSKQNKKRKNSQIDSPSEVETNANDVVGTIDLSAFDMLSSSSSSSSSTSNSSSSSSPSPDEHIRMRYWSAIRLPQMNWQDLTMEEISNLMWPTEVTFEMKCRYIGHTLLGNETSETEVARYFTTFEHMVSAPNLTLIAAQLIFGFVDPSRRKMVICLSLDLVKMFVFQRKNTFFAHLTVEQLTTRINNVFSMAHRMFMLMCKATAVADSARSGKLKQIIDPEEFYVEPDESEKLLLHQELLETLLLKATSQSLRRKDTMMFKPVITEGGLHTKYYTEYVEILEYIYECCPRTNETTYRILTSKQNTPQHMKGLLEKLNDVRVPFLKQCRHLFAFENGLLDVKKNIFYVNDSQTRSVDHFIQNTAELDDQTCSSNYLPYHLDLKMFFSSIPESVSDMVENDPDEQICALENNIRSTASKYSYKGCRIETPIFDKILVDQGFNRKDIHWCMIMMARSLFDVNEMDAWQAIFFLRGVAGSGKSTLLKLLCEFYPAHNIGSIMSDGQSTFFDEHLIDKLIVIAMDADSSTTWSRTRFNSYASGETITVNRKNKMAISKRWSAHIFMASNTFPSFQVSTIMSVFCHLFVKTSHTRIVRYMAYMTYHTCVCI
jgi:ABC-type multidrug transport system fused ATPase/permease subunit